MCGRGEWRVSGMCKILQMMGTCSIFSTKRNKRRMQGWEKNWSQQADYKCWVSDERVAAPLMPQTALHKRVTTDDASG